MNKLISIGLSTLLSGGIASHGTIDGYISDSMRRILGIPLGAMQDGSVRYFAKRADILKRAAVQAASQTAYGMLRSYPRYVKYWEQRERDKYLQSQSQTSRANKSGQYYRLIEKQQPVKRDKPIMDSIVGNLVSDYLELSIPMEGKYYNSDKGEVEFNYLYGLTTFIDLQPAVQVSRANNILLTTVEGRDFTRKELISGGDLKVNITGKITSKYPDVYPEAEISKFLHLVAFKGVLDCDNTVLRQFNISQLIIQSYSFQPPTCRNIQPYTLQCVAVEPSDSVSVKREEPEAVDKASKHNNQWIRIVKIGTDAVDPSSLLKLTQLWI